jgi:uncharacterized membrane protein
MLISELFLWFLFYSFLGWLYESVVCSLCEKRRLINRGFLFGPYCPIYGITIMLALWLLWNITNLAAVFVLAIVISGAFEYFCSFLMEKVYKRRWWDYTNKAFNLNGRVYLEGLLIFGTAISIFKFIVQPALMRFTGALDNDMVDMLALLLAVVFASDIIVTVWKMQRGKRLQRQR